MGEEERKEKQESKTSQMAYFGKISLWVAIVGIVLPLALALLLVAVDRLTNYETIIPQRLYTLHFALETAALVTGVLGFRSRYGKAGLIISVILLIMMTYIFHFR